MMFPKPPRPPAWAGSRDRERDLEWGGDPDMLPAPPRPNECYQGLLS
jgi:hypothetical protein